MNGLKLDSTGQSTGIFSGNQLEINSLVKLFKKGIMVISLLLEVITFNF